MFDAGRLHSIEQNMGFHYPPTFWAGFGELSGVAALPRFTEEFPQARQATSADVAGAWESGAPNSLVPFACVDQPTHTDYYCCVREGCQPGRAEVSVFALHTVVADWPDFAAFIAWLRDRCRDKQAEPGAAADGGG